MKRASWILPLAGLFLLLTATSAWAAAPGDLKAAKTASQQTTLIWTPGPGADTPEYSLDGLAWTLIPVASAGSGVRLDSSAVPGESRVVGLTDYTNYYFRIKNVDGAATAFSSVVAAFPPDEHAHRYFAANSNMCAKCHSTHVARGAKLLKETTLNDICKTCHFSGTGSKYQVDTGTVAGAGGAKLTALAGFFGSSVSSGPGLPATTSTHPVSSRRVALAPGGDPDDLNGKWSEIMTCGSCHNAHAGPTYQYRLLRADLPNMMQSTGGTPRTLDSVKVEAYAVTRGDKEAAVYVSGLNNFCGGCHADYNTSGIAGSPSRVINGVYNTAFYRHAVGKELQNFMGRAGVHLDTTLPMESSAALWDGNTRQGAGTVFCMTCHKPHGVNTAGNFVLLRMSNRGVCQDCHQK